MSLILDALRKLDREKSERKGDVASGILKADDPPRGRRIMPLALTLGGTACAAVIITYLAVGNYGPRLVNTRSGRSEAPVQARQATGSALPAAPSSSSPAMREGSANAPAHAVPATILPRKAIAGREPASKRGPAHTGQVLKGETARREDTAVAPPELKVSGIVWQEAPSDRKAVINGRIAREGDTVDGARVLEIYPTFVSLSFKGRSFKVKIFD
jgi:hypothetical protein